MDNISERQLSKWFNLPSKKGLPMGAFFLSRVTTFEKEIWMQARKQEVTKIVFLVWRKIYQVCLL